jgi:transposase
MPPVDRKNPKRAASSDSDWSLVEFTREFGDDDACLEYLWRSRFSEDGEHAICPKCKKLRPFKTYETKQRRGGSRTCTGCGNHLSVLSGTIFEGSPTSLHLWFYAIYVMTSTRCGISAKQLERELGVTYKTAWRMFNKIRNELMDEAGEPLSGDVEIDETSWGGRPRQKLDRRKAAAFREAKPTILGMVERGGRVKLSVIPSRRGPALSREVRERVNPSAIIFTDDWPAYRPLRGEFLEHRVINQTAVVYV